MTESQRLAVLVGVATLALGGWALGGPAGAVPGAVLGLLVLAVRYRRRPLWSWAYLYLRRHRRLELVDPVTAVNDRTAGGVRYQDGVATSVIQLLGKAHTPTFLTGTNTAYTSNAVDISDLRPLMDQSLGLRLESLTVVCAGARSDSTVDYARVYDTLVAAPQYAGRRETWLVLRIRAMDNADALRCRTTAATAALAAAQRMAAGLRRSGLRARIASAKDIAEMERRLGRAALAPGNRRWRTIRGDDGWLTTYAYPPAQIATESLARAWSLRGDAVIQRLTLFPDGTACATVTLRSGQPPQNPPSSTLQALPGEQAQAAAANLCGPLPDLRGAGRGPLPQRLVLPIGSSGVLLGRLTAGGRLALPLGDPGTHSHVHVAARDVIAKRLVVRAVGMGERVTVHTTDTARWNSVKMPHVTVIDHPRPVPGTTLSVVDGTVALSARPGTVVSVGAPGTAGPEPADVVIAEAGPSRIQVSTAGEVYDVEVELFRAENRYVSAGSGSDQGAGR